MKSFLNVLQTVILLVSVLAANSLPAATVAWSGAGANDNWSTALNWTGGTPAGNAVLFTDDDATGVSGPFGTPNNIVDASVTIQSLKCGNTIGFHTTQIPSGSTLTVGGTATTNLYVGTGTDAGGVQTVYATVLGQGSLLATNTSGNISVIQGSGTSGAKLATLDMEGLNTFTAYVNQIRVAAENGGTSTPQYNRPNGTLILARTNLISCTANPGLLVSRTSGNGGTCEVKLGQDNVILSDGGITVGGRKSVDSKLIFNPSFSSPRALFRNEAGTDRQGTWIVGDQSEQGGTTGTSATGSIDFTSGTVDALVDTIVVGRGSTTTTLGGAGTGTLTFDTGTIDVNTLDIGVQALSTGGPGNGAVNVNGSGLLVANTIIRLTRTLGGSASAELKINGGTVRANTIVNGGGTTIADIVMAAGGTLVLTNTAGTPTTPILTLWTTDSTVQLRVSAGTTNICVNTLLATGSTSNNTISILSLPTITSFPVQYPLISYVTGSSDFLLGTLPPAYQGYISNNTVTSTIDLVITNGPRNLTWNGNLSGDWNTGTQNWLYLGSPSAYNQYDSVVFDNNVSGNTTVNLTTALTPSSIAVNNASPVTFTFTGTGSLEGAAALNKTESGTFILANSGVNTFSGGVSVLGGTLRLSGSADRLPTSSTVTLADVSGAALDLNGQNQTIATLAGGGASGGNVALGNATLTIAYGGANHAGVISGSGSVVKAGAGTQVLAGANLYGGGTVISEGTLAIANNSGSGAGSGVIQIQTNATFAFGTGGVGGSVAVPMITNNGAVVFDRSDNFTCNIPITGNGSVTKANSNSIVTIPVANTYTGLTTVAAGGLRISNAGALGTADSRTIIQNDPSARLELTGSVILLEPLYVNQKQTAAGNVPCVLNVSGDNTLAGEIELPTGGSYWIFHSAAGRLIVSGAVTNSTTSNTRTLWLSGPSDGEWNSGLKDGAGGNPAAIRKDGPGTWTLAGTYTQSGSTVVSNGTLLVNGTIAAGSVTVNGGTLGGNGSISVPVTVNSGGTLSPGTSIGKLSIYNSLTLADGSTTVMELSKFGSTITNDQVSVLTTLTVGGTLNVNLTDTVTGGEVFTLFSAGTFQSGASFSAINTPTLPGLTWDTSKLTVNGTLSVVGSQPRLNFSQSGNVLTFSWSEAGFKLQAQTNAAGISTNWSDYLPGGSSPPVNVTIDPANPSVFFRLSQ